MKGSIPEASSSADAVQAGGLNSPTRERPSRHGALLGAALAEIAQLGRNETPGLPEMCATCAFRPGCMTNQMASTGLVALKCVTGADTDLFVCHHGMKDGEPTAICAGYVAALAAPLPLVQSVIREMVQTLDAVEGEPDAVRAAFDAWIAEVDPESRLDDYQRGRLYLKRYPAAGTPALPVGNGHVGAEPGPAQRSEPPSYPSSRTTGAE